jgi:hypothetical protein
VSCLWARWSFHEPSPSEPVLEVEVGGVLCLPLRIFDPLELNPSRSGNILEVPAEAALILAIGNPIHPRKDVKVDAAYHILGIVIVRYCWFPAQRHALSCFSSRSAYPTKG